MRVFIIVVVLAALAACGAETATTAATSASIKKREIEEGKKTMDRTRESIDQAMEQTHNRAAKDADQK